MQRQQRLGTLLRLPVGCQVWQWWQAGNPATLCSVVTSTQAHPIPRNKRSC